MKFDSISLILVVSICVVLWTALSLPKARR